MIKVNNKKEELKYKAYNFSIKIIKFITKLPNERVYWVLTDQLLRSSTSIGANAIEAQAASSKRDFIKFYEIAPKSANETKYWLGLLRDATGAYKNKIRPLLEETNSLSNILGVSLLTLKGKRKT